MKIKVTSSEIVGVIYPVDRSQGVEPVDRDAVLAHNATAAALRATDRNRHDRRFTLDGIYRLISTAAGEDVASHVLTDLDRLLFILSDPETNRTLTFIDRLRDACQRCYPHRQDLRAIIAALELSRAILSVEPLLLPQQLLARLSPDDGPTIAALLARARRRLGRPALIPLTPTLYRPGGPLRSSLMAAGHRLTAIALVSGIEQVALADDRYLLMCHLREGTTQKLAEHGGAVTCLVYEPARGLLIAADRGGPIRAWGLDGALRWELPIRAGATLALALTPRGALLSGGTDGVLRLWDLDTGGLWRAVIADGPDITSIAMLPDGRVILGGDFARQHHHVLRVLHLDHPEEHGDLGEFEWPVQALAVTDDSRAVIAASNQTLSAWDLERGSRRFALQHQERLSAIAAVSGGQLAVTAAFGGPLVCDLTTGTWRARLCGHHDYVGDVAVASEEGACVSVSRDQSIKVWDVRAAYQEAHEGAVTTLAFTADGGHVISGGVDGRLCLWSSRTHQLVRAVRAHGHAVRGLASVPQSRLLLSAAWDGSLRLWRIDGGGAAADHAGAAAELVCAWRPPSVTDDPLRAFALAPTGAYAALGRSAGVVERLWLARAKGIPSIASQDTLQTAVGDVRSLAITRAGDLFVGGQRGLVRLGSSTAVASPQGAGTVRGLGVPPHDSPGHRTGLRRLREGAARRGAVGGGSCVTPRART